MSDNRRWPAMMHTHPERVRVWPYTASTEQAYDWESSYLAEDMRLNTAPIMDREAEYIRADIAEARIMELEAERDALRQRIADAPKIVAHCVATPGAVGGARISSPAYDIRSLQPVHGKKVALVVETDQ